MMIKTMALFVCLVFLNHGVQAQSSETKAEEMAPGEFIGAVNATHPDWFKESFLDFGDDIQEAAVEGKRLALYFWQPGCPYCDRLWAHNMAVDGIEENFQSRFDVVAINMWGDQEVVTVAGKQFTEKQLARALDVDFTPTLIFYDENRKITLRLNGYLPPERFRPALDYASGDHAPGQTFSAYMLAQTAPGAGLSRSQSFFKSPEVALSNRRLTPAKRPLAVIFETGDCVSCENFHDITLKHEDTRALLASMDVVQLDAHSTSIVTLPDGQKSTAAKWAESLSLNYYPSIVLFDESGQQVMLMDAYFRNFHTQSIFAYVLEKAYLEEPSFQRYISARAEKFNEQGIDVDIWQE